MATFAGERLTGTFTKTASNGRTITIKSDFTRFPISGASNLGTMTCQYKSQTYRCILLPSFQSAEQSMKAYLQELINLEYRAQKNARDVLMKEVIKFSLSDLIDLKIENIKAKMRPTELGLEALQLGGLDSTIEDCFNYGKDIRNIKNKIEKNPGDIDGIRKCIEELTNIEVPLPKGALYRLIVRFNGAQKDFRENILKIYDSDSLLNRLLRCIRFNCPVSIKVYKDGQQIGYVSDDDIWYNKDIIIEECSGAKTIYTAPNDEISFEIIGTSDGEMSYSIEDLEEGSITGRLNSYNISIREGQTFTGALPNVRLEDNQDAFALQSEGEIILPTEYIPVSESAYVDINVTSTPADAGDTSGTGRYVRGDAVILCASPKADYIFSGWYDDSGVLISQNSVYEFSAIEDCTLEARFIEDTYIPEDPGSNVQMYLISFDAAGGILESYLKITDENGRLDELVSPICYGYTFDGWYTEADGGEIVDENWVYTTDTTLYAHWIRSYIIVRALNVAGSSTVIDLDIPEQFSGYSMQVIAARYENGKMATAISAVSSENGQVEFPVNIEWNQGWKLFFLSSKEMKPLCITTVLMQ